jgi:hypothetical protein
MNPIYRTPTQSSLLLTHSSSWSEFSSVRARVPTVADPISRNDPTPDRGAQVPRAAALIVSSLGFIHDLRAGLLQPDSVRGTPLDMDQYNRLFGTSRIPTDVRCIHNHLRFFLALTLD